MKTFKNLSRALHVFKLIFRYLRLSNSPSADYEDLKARFTSELLQHLNFRLKIANDTSTPRGPVIYVCNHIGYMDIPVIMNLLPQACFVSKQEVAKWPLIGTAAIRIKTIFVKRESKASRSQTRQALHKALVQNQQQVVVFPSGTTSLGASENWRKGIFEIAKDNNIPIIPLRLNYRPLRSLAYIDQDNFVLHLINLVGIPKIEATLEMGEALAITNPVDDCKRIKTWCETPEARRSLGALALLEV